jgi:NAD(P)-dependent dehydrogenase (short-subunit alcohol dehydrogenase family)
MVGSHIFKKGWKRIKEKFYKGQNCIIFGANSFIGKLLSKFLSQNQVNLGLIDLVSHKDYQIVDPLYNENKVIYKIVNSGSEDEIIDCVEEVSQNLGDVNYLICCYYIEDLKRNIKKQDLSIETWDYLFKEWIVNYFLVMKAVVPLMIKENKGRIVFFITTTGYTGEGEGEGEITLSGSIHESACSSAITGMMTSIAADVISRGVSLNGIALGSNYKKDIDEIIWAINLWLSGLGEYSCGQILRLY